MAKVSRTYRIEQKTADKITEIAENENMTATEVDEGGERWRIGSARPLVTVYLLCISVCITLCIRRLLVKRIDEPANQISLRTSSQLGNLF